MSRIIEALEPFYGIQNGGDRGNQYQKMAERPMDALAKTQEDLAKELGIDIRTLQRYKQLSELIPEMQELVESGAMSFSVASRMVTRLSPEEQKTLSDALPVGEKVTAAIAKQYLGFLLQLRNITDK